MIFRGEDTVQIDIEQPTTTKQPSGDLVTTWGIVHVCYANKRFKRGSERFMDNQKQAEERIEWRIRFTQCITELMRIREGADVYDIQSIEKRQRDGYMVLTTQSFPNREQSTRIGAGQ